jgi:hypothetical protein
MAAFNFLPGFKEHLAEKVHNLGSDQLVIALSNTAPGSEGTPPNGSTAACVLANVTQISYANVSTRNLTTTVSALSGGSYELTVDDLTLTATGAVGPFRYVYLYNDTASAPADALIGYWDYGSSISLANGETFRIDLSGPLLSW